jgi:cold shock CspA family protein
MAKSQQSFNKAEKEKKKAKKKKEKLLRKEERKANATGGGLDSMIAYVDEFGNITDTPPDPSKKEKISAENIEIGVPKKENVFVDPIKKGRVDFFNDAKGFGFIKETGTGESFFVHINGCEYDIAEGDMVSFELEKGLKGMNAVRVKKQ